MKFGTDGAWHAWVTLAGLSEHKEVQVVVDPASTLGPDGWVAILTVGKHIAAAVPSSGLLQPVADALSGLTSDQAVTPALILRRLPLATAILGPATLFYPPRGFSSPRGPRITAVPGELGALTAVVDATELDESGIEHIQSPCFVSRNVDGTVAAVCGYRRWPNGVAHLSVLTRPSERRRGHGRKAAEAAIGHAVDAELLPQWRARFEPSMSLAKALGLTRVGAQFSMKPAQAMIST